MTQEGRNWLLRVEIRCAEQWGIALWEMENNNSPWQPDPCSPSYDSYIWHMAIRTVHSLRTTGGSDGGHFERHQAGDTAG